MRSNKTIFGCYTTPNEIILMPGARCRYHGVLPAGESGDIVTIKEIFGFCDRDPSKIYASVTYGEMKHETKIRLVDNHAKFVLVETPMEVIMKAKSCFDASLVVEEDNTLKVGQIWEHYKGACYRILGLALDAENPENLNNATVQYANIDKPNAPVWSLRLADWFSYKTMDRDGRTTRMVRFFNTHNPLITINHQHRSLFQLWNDVHTHVND